MENFSKFVQDPTLSEAVVAKSKRGTPIIYTGGYNMVFRLEQAGEKWAYRIWFAPMGDMKFRYEKISELLTKNDLPFFAKFLYEENAILISGILSDVVRMEWVEGQLLKDYLEEIILDGQKLKTLARKFLDLAKTLHEKKISHGDLQEKNIIVTEAGELMLIDYDSICIPDFEGGTQFIAGQEGYQHPSRFTIGEATVSADYFSELIIFLSLEALSENPDLWHNYKLADTNYLLFTKEDFADLEKAAIYQDLRRLEAPLIDALLDVLVQYLAATSYLELRPFYTQLDSKLLDAQTAQKVVVKEDSDTKTASMIADLMIKIELGQDTTAIKKIFELAEADVALARYELGKLFYRGEFMEANRGEAIRWLRKGEAANHIPSIVELGMIYLQEEEPKLQEKGFDLLRKGAMYEHKEAILASAECLWYGIGTKKNRIKAKTQYLDAIERQAKQAWHKFVLALSHLYFEDYILTIFEPNFFQGFNQDVYQECKTLYKDSFVQPLVILNHHHSTGVPKNYGIVITAKGLLWNNVGKENLPSKIAWSDIRRASIKRQNNRIILNGKEEPAYYPSVGVRDTLYQGLEKLIYEVLDTLNR